MDTIKGYEIQERIDAGGFGAVYRALQTTVGREVAIKVILPHFANNPDFIRRFEAEAQLVARLEHMNIIPLYDYWRDPTGAYLVMRWLRGGSLRDMLKQGPLDLNNTLDILAQVGAALSMAHRNGVVHRDVKPANILLDEDGNAYLGDFGIAKDIKRTNGNLTGEDVVIGAPDYISPEQLRGEPVTPATDIYNLGVMLFDMLRGEHPFPGSTPVEQMYKHLNDPMPRLDVFAEAESLNAVIQTATAKNPQHRYSDVLALLNDLKEAVRKQDQPDTADIVELLTPREQEILSLMINGRSNAEIAKELVIAPATVKWYNKQIFKKLGARSRVQAIVKGRHLDLVFEAGGERVETGATYIVDTSQFQPTNPYKGLRAFQTADSHDFFGREQSTHKLVNRLAATRFLAVVGPSGSGKSSVVKAGLIPAIWRGAIPGSDKWFVVDFIPGARPFDELEVALMRVASQQAHVIGEQLARDEHGLSRLTKLILPDDNSQLVVVIDQFEEIFTLVEREEERVRFLNLLEAAVNDPRSRVRLVVTLRADFFDRPLHYPQISDLVRENMETILPLTAEELERAIAEPARRVGVTFEEGLVATIISEINYQAGALPLLQYALTELFEKREKRYLTHAAYQAIGGSTGALARRADETYEELDAAGQEAVRQIFMRLVTLGEGTEDTRRRVARRELLALTDSPESLDEIIDTYAGYRLLSLDHDPASREPTVEVAHEAILREWQRLRAWLNASREDIKTQRRLSEAAVAWQQNQREASYLVGGARLGRFEAWAKETTLALTPLEREFLAAGVAAEKSAERHEQERQAREAALRTRAHRVLQGLVAVLLVATLLSGGLALVALDRQNQAQAAQKTAQQERDRARREAEVNHSLVLASNAARVYGDSDSTLATVLALEAVNMDNPPAESVRVLRDIAGSPGKRAILQGHTQEVRAVAFSTDGHYGLSGSCAVLDSDSNCVSGEVVLWDILSQTEIGRFVRHSDWVTSAIFTPEGQALTASLDGTIILWDMPSGDEVRRFEGHAGSVTTLAMLPDGVSFLSGGDDGAIIRWELASGKIIQTYAGHSAAVNVVVVHPNQQSFGSGSADTTIILWDIQSGAQLGIFEGHSAAVLDIVFRSDGTVLSSSDNLTLLMWNLQTNAVLREAIFILSPIALEITPDDRYLVMRDSNAVLSLWHIDEWRYEYIDVLFNDVITAVMSPDGRFVLGGASNGGVLLWEIGGSKLRQFGDRMTRLSTVTVSPNGRLLVTGTMLGGDVIIWDRVDGTEVRRLSGHQGTIGDVAFSADGQSLLVASGTLFDGSEGFAGTLALWSVDTGEMLRELQGYEYWPWRAVFSADGMLVAGSTIYWKSGELLGRGDTLVWDATTGEQLQRIDFEYMTNGLTFLPQGDRLFTTTNMGTEIGAMVWDIHSGQRQDHFIDYQGLEAVELVAGTSWVLVGEVETATDMLLLDYETLEIIRRYSSEIWIRSIDLSPDQRTIITGDDKGQVVLWDFETGVQIQRFEGHSQRAWDVAFGPDGLTAYSAGTDGTVIEWDVEQRSLDELVTWVEANRYLRDFTPAECEQYRIEQPCGE